MDITPVRLVEFLIQYAFFLLSASVHESAHAWTAFKFGDPTAKMQNRISLNPANHIDIVGTVIIPFAVFITGFPIIGWAKPTPVNPANFSNPRRDDMFVSGAGPVSNILSVIVLAIPWHIAFSFVRAQIELLPANAHYADFSMTAKVALLFCYVLGSGILVNLMLAVFNMLPIHPLDGSGVLEGLLPKTWSEAYAKMRPYGFIILLVFFYLPAFGRLIRSVISFLGSLFRVQFFSLQGIW